MIQLYQTLDLRPIGIPQTLRLSQYDSDFEIIFELTNFDGAWILDTNTTAEVQGTKTDGHGYSADAVFDDQLKTVTIAGDVQMTAAAGRNVYEVVLFHDGDRLGSKNFVLDVERAALDAETTASDSKIKNFTEMVEAAEDAAETATAAAEAAEEAAATFSTDTTLSAAGKAADAATTGAELGQRFALSTGDRTSIASGSDLDTYTTAGNYKVTSSTAANNIAHIPRKVSGVLSVLSGSDANRVYQLYFAQTSDNLEMYSRERLGASAEWTDWFEVTERYTLDNVPTDGSDNPVKSNGVYDAVQAVAADLSALDSDLKLGADGVTYASAGDAVRGQVAAICADADTVETILMPNAFSVPFFAEASNWTVGSNIGATGGNKTDTAAARTSYYRLTSPMRVSLKNQAYKFIVWYYSSNSVSSALGKAKPNYDNNDVIVYPHGAYAYIRMAVITADGSAFSGDASDPDSDLYAVLQDLTFYELNQSQSEMNLVDALVKKDKTSAGLTYTWDSTGERCAVSGTATGTSFNSMYLSETALPAGIEAGGSYLFACASEKVYLRVVYYDQYGNDTLLGMVRGGDTQKMTIPSAAAGLSIRLYMPTNGAVVNETVIPQIYAEKTDFEKTVARDMIGAASAEMKGGLSPNTHLLSVGNSFLTGAVYTNGSFDHLSTYENSTYGAIATALAIPEANVSHTLHSSSGIIKKNDGSNLVDIIKTKDLSGYDYVLTGMSGSDMSYQLGSINSTKADGTIAGALLDLLDYVTTSNGLCRVILLSVPPYSSNLDISGQNTFTGLYTNGKSLTDLDELMFAMAAKYHFIYVSWQDNPISYHYMDFADYIGDNQGSRHASSEATYRNMGQYAGMQIKAVNSPLALKIIAGLE